MTTVKTCKTPPSLVTCGQALNMRVAVGDGGIGLRVETVRKPPPNVNFMGITNELVRNREPISRRACGGALPTQVGTNARAALLQAIDTPVSPENAMNNMENGSAPEGL